MDKREIEKLRLKTQMSETLHLINTSPYQSLRDNATLKLKFLQEQYKGAFGEYSKDHEIIVENNEETFPLSANRIFNVLSGASFEKWYEKDFIDFIEGVENAKDKATILKDLKDMFK